MMDTTDSPQPFPNRDANYRARAKDKSMVTGGARSKRGRWRRGKSRRKLETAAKDRGPKTVAPEEAARDQPDRLLLSALKYLEVERDLIEERLANVRSAAVTS